MPTSIDRTGIAILHTLEEADKPLGATVIARSLAEHGIELTDRAVRYHLQMLDTRGFTESLGRGGRKITHTGRRELQDALVADKVGFVLSHVQELSFKTTFDPATRHGDIILNVSLFPARSLGRALKIMAPVFKNRLCTSDLVAFAAEDEVLNGIRVPLGMVALGTVCSVTINGALLRRGIPIDSLFGGLLEMDRARPIRFTEIIHYAGTSIDPLEIFIKGRMTSVRDAARRGAGKVGASFREVPAVCMEGVHAITAEMEAASIFGVLTSGKPGQALLEIPVSAERVGLVVLGGLNPLAAAEEAGIETQNHAMTAPYPFARLVSYWDL